MNIDFKVCAVQQLGTSLTNCIQTLGYPKGFIKVANTFSESLATEVNQAYFETKVQEGVFVPFLGADNNELPPAEDVTQELANGVQRIVRSGKPVFNFGYLNGGYYLHKIFSSYKGNNFGKVLLVFENGKILVATNQSGTEWSGFDVGMFTSQYTPNTGSEDEQVTAMMQLVNTEQFEKLGAIVDSETLGFDPNFLQGVIESKVTVLSASTTSVTASVVALFNTAINIEGLTDNEFKVTVDGVEDAVTAVTYLNGVYTITITTALTAGDVVVVSLFDQTLETIIVKSGDLFYKGTSNTFTAS